MSAKRARAPATWERGYLSHHYWAGKVAIGNVHVNPPGEPHGRYRWRCLTANVGGLEKTLRAAKRAVEQVYRQGIYQPELDMF